jgi:hypothetical protein
LGGLAKSREKEENPRDTLLPERIFSDEAYSILDTNATPYLHSHQRSIGRPSA